MKRSAKSLVMKPQYASKEQRVRTKYKRKDKYKQDYRHGESSSRIYTY